MKEKRGSRYALGFASFVSFCVCLALIILLRILQEPDVVIWYNNYIDVLASYEHWLQTYGATFFSVIIILLNFALKAVVVWFPLPCICVASGVLFKWYWAVVINLIGLTILFSIKYFWGKKIGGGNAEKILSKYDVAHNFIDRSKLGSVAVLFALRLVPSIPVNSVSQLYGTTDIKYSKYIVVSVLGFVYKLLSYTIIGRNVFDPFSFGFFLPLIILTMFSGIVLMLLNGLVGISDIGKEFWAKMKLKKELKK